ncbi:MAG: hypothetical protein CSA20_01620 [Deltaproteobacteria bacterium]|nr:MAG: hypothetical protein CSA20_01620 [Deltaproteobacteria bacterium]
MIVHPCRCKRFKPTPSPLYTIRCCFLTLLVIFLMPMMAGTAFATDTPLIKTHIKVALIQSAFLGSNENDAAAAFKTFAKTIGKHKGYDMEITVSTFKDASELAALPESERPHIVILEGWAFLEIEKEGWLTPVTVTSIGRGKVLTPYKILVPASSTANTIEDLRGKAINILFMPQTQTALPWLRSLLQQHKLGTMASFFGDILIENDPMKAMLPVFFGQRDAGLINAEKFELMAELNPQLNKMRVIATSQPLVSGITAVNHTAVWDNPTIKEDFIDALLKLHLCPAGQQILHLFKTDQVIAYRPEYLDTIRTIHQALVGPQL